MENCKQQPKKIIFPSCPIEDHESRLNQICLQNDCKKFFSPVCGECIEDNTHMHKENEINNYNLIKELLNKAYAEQDQFKNQQKQGGLQEIEQKWRQLAKDFKILSEKCMKISEEINGLLANDKNQDLQNIKDFFDNNKNIQIEQLNQQLSELKKITITKKCQEQYNQQNFVLRQLEFQQVNLEEIKYNLEAFTYNNTIYKQIDKIIKNIDLNRKDPLGYNTIRINTKINLKQGDFEFIQESLAKSKNGIKVTELKYSTFRDGGDCTNFHKFCDCIGPHLILVQIKDHGVLGGFVPDSSVWQSKSREVKPQTNLDPFLFYCPQKLVCQLQQNNRKYAYFDYPSFGPIFGGTQTGNDDFQITKSLKEGILNIGKYYQRGNLILENKSYELEGFEVYLLQIPQN